jgi:hypothetical protein
MPKSKLWLMTRDAKANQAASNTPRASAESRCLASRESLLTKKTIPRMIKGSNQIPPSVNHSNHIDSAWWNHDAEGCWAVGK